MKEAISIFAILAATPLALFLTRLARARLGLGAELSRKLLHILMGLILCPLPWLFDRVWPVLLICGVYLALLIARRFSKLLDRQVADVIYSVQRRSLGEFLFPITVAALFILARHRPALYLAPMLILTFADAAAALVGRRYGLCKYTSTGECKSLEGSLAFAAAAFASTHLTLLLIGGAGRAESVLIALAIAIVLAVVEALTIGGWDNLLVPLGGWMMLLMLGGLAIPALCAAALAAIILACGAMVAVGPRAGAKPVARIAPPVARTQMIRMSD